MSNGWTRCLSPALGGGRSEVRAGFLCSLVGAGEAQGCSLHWTLCIYSSGEVHGANRKEYISLLLKIPRIAKQDLAFSCFVFVLCSKIQFELVKSGLHEADKSRGTPLKTGVSSGGGKETQETPSALAFPELLCFWSLWQPAAFSSLSPGSGASLDIKQQNRTNFTLPTFPNTASFSVYLVTLTLLFKNLLFIYFYPDLLYSFNFRFFPSPPLLGISELILTI